MIEFKMIKFCKAYIPSGMYRPVEWNTPLQSLHPVKDASLTGCGNSGGIFFLPSLLVAVKKYSDFYWLWQAFRNNKFADCAISANANYIVSNDKHFNVLKYIDFRKVNLLTIDEFRAVIQG